MTSLGAFLMFLFLFDLLNLAKAAGAGWEEQVCRLDELDPAQFKQFVGPLLQITANTYRFPDLEPVPGWVLAPKITPLSPQGGGAHALVYIEEGSGERLVLGFRGTDLGNLCDECADLELFQSFIPGIDPPDESVCASLFSRATLDYYAQAVDFTHKVLAAYPQLPILVTGHSLGAALANLVSANFSSDSRVFPVVSFGTPPMRSVLERKSVRVRHPELVYGVGDEWDFVMQPVENQVGSVCLYQRAEPSDCATCKLKFGDLEGGQRIALEEEEEDASCFGCFMQTHYLKHFIELVIAAEIKPVCNFL